jgi:isochorismate synthase
MNHTALLQALDHCIRERLTFAAFRVPGGAVTLWAQQTPELDRVESGLWWELNDVFLLAPFVPEERTALIRSDVELTFGEGEPNWQRLHECVGAPAMAVTHARGGTSREAFDRAVAEARDACAAGDMEKVVLSRTIELSIGATDAPTLFVEALRTRPDGFVALAMTPEHGLWLGATPERLVLAENDTLLVDALAGTVAAAQASMDPAAWGSKERHEQRVVTKMIAAALIDLGAQRVLVEGPSVLQAGPVAHLRTGITATLDGRMVEGVVQALHPTPAVCGIPTGRARQWIARAEDRGRELYAGFWGPWSADGRMELFVNIRCMRLHEAHAELRVGAGITVGSDPAAEWVETEHKADAWRRLLPVQAGA